jgi:hypothetical protein
MEPVSTHQSPGAFGRHDSVKEVWDNEVQMKLFLEALNCFVAEHPE